jgi:hypothetical protein
MLPPEEALMADKSSELMAAEGLLSPRHEGILSLRIVKQIPAHSAKITSAYCHGAFYRLQVACALLRCG